MSESPILYSLRGLVLLAALVVFPVVAVGWRQFAEINRRPVANAPANLGESLANGNTPTDSKPEQTQQIDADGFNEKAVFVPPADNSPPFGRTMQNISARTDTAEPPGFSQTNMRKEQNTPPNQQNFRTLEEHLKLLGAKTYKLEKWGNQGNLFRFSCLVTSPDTYRYEKQFQAIGADEMNVMRTVIEDIEHWKQKTVAF